MDTVTKAAYFSK